MLSCVSLRRQRVRYSIESLQEKYERGERKPLEDVWRAFAAIQALPPNDPDSFFVIGGLHGEPFELRPEVDRLRDVDRYPYWGGWCEHGNILFPTWHRAYVLRLEDALCAAVPDLLGLPFFDECSQSALADGLPWAVTRDKVTLDGVEVRNPLRSFTLPQPLQDMPGTSEYIKPAGYETVRYPFAGLAGSVEAAADSARINAGVERTLRGAKQTPNGVLNAAVAASLAGPISMGTVARGSQGLPDGRTGSAAMFRASLEAPSYALFSNKTSADAYNQAVVMGGGRSAQLVQSLEIPHNNTHIAIGNGPQVADPAFPDASGDMGENNTAGLDPVFFLHHCFIDLVFQKWQERHAATTKLPPPPYANYPGTSNSIAPTPRMALEAVLDYSTALQPFHKRGAVKGVFYNSDDVTDIAKLNYAYGPSSLDAPPTAPPLSSFDVPVLAVLGVNREVFEGSFTITAYAELPGLLGGRTVALGQETVLSRFNLKKCQNCLSHLPASFFFPIYALTADEIAKARFYVVPSHKRRVSGQRLHLLQWECFVDGKPARMKAQPAPLKPRAH